MVLRLMSRRHTLNLRKLNKEKETTDGSTNTSDTCIDCAWGGFIFFAANVIWLGTKEFFKVYGPKSKKPEATTATAAIAPATPTTAPAATTPTPAAP